ncbi:MAG: molecular chaperone DnaJ, partial [Cyanobacteria bacterium J06597_16]
MFQVNQSYKDLVFIWHPDRIPSDRDRLRQKAETKLKQLNEARALLRSHAKEGKLPNAKAAGTAASRTASRTASKTASRTASKTAAAGKNRYARNRST